MNRKVLLAFGVGALLATGTPAMALDKNNAETYRLLNLFGDVFERVRKEYVEEVTDEELVEAALNGMLTSLDPHSGYLSAKNFRDMQVQTRGEFGGLGIEVTMENGFVKVVSPIDDTPAYRAGLQPGDFITHLDGEPVSGLSLNEAVDRMRGPAQSDIRLSVRREGAEPFDVKLTRAVIKVQSVRSKTFETIGYVRITAFNELTEVGLKKAMGDIQSQLGDKLQGYVIDLRNNPGGLLDQAVAVSDAFLNQGEIVSTRSRRPEEIQRFNARPGDLAKGLPLVVLINDGSASASEIVAGALQDHHRAIVMGTKSFGKGSVQTVIPLTGHGAMRLTTARYYTPSGRSIQAVGIEPDLKVQQARVEVLASAGDRRTEATLRGALRNDNDKDKGKATPHEAVPETAPAPAPALPAPTPEGKPGVELKPGAADTTAAKPGEPPKNADAVKLGEPAQDFQLARAIDLLRGLSLYKQHAAN
ncbi:MAG: S41 family peptidase [Alphaproteobacteria bacterium]|nr:S41 family peptidase [Alphaproteobacteria bacterium]